MIEHFTDTIFYQIELTAKYIKLLGNQVFEELDAGVNVEEYVILDTLIVNQALCQRDIARLILKDRANTGKLLDGLEKKGFITRKLSIRNNRPIKLAQLTDAGKKKYQYAESRIKVHYKTVKESIVNSELAQIGDSLKKLREILNSTVKIHI